MPGTVIVAGARTPIGKLAGALGGPSPPPNWAVSPSPGPWTGPV